MIISDFLTNFYINLGEYYEAGEYFSQNFDTALSYYTKALENGSILAYFKIGRVYEAKGEMQKALKNYLDGAIRSDEESVFALGRLAREGNEFLAIANYYLGIMFEHNQNWRKTIECYNKSASKQYVPAMYRLGKLYAQDRMEENVIIVPKNIVESLKWYRKAATYFSAHALDALITLAPSIPEAAIHLGQMYELGEGVPQKLDRALELFIIASDLGNKEGFYFAGRMYEKDDPEIEKNLKLAYDYYLKAAKQRHAQALIDLNRLVQILKDPAKEFQLGEIYQNTLNDIPAALKWYISATQKKDITAEQRLKIIANSDPNYAYEIGKLYDSSQMGENIKQANVYYIIALHKKHQKTKDHVEASATSGNSEAQYIFGYEYYHQCMSDILAAVNWCMQAAEQKHALALQYLENTNFSAEIFFKIAQTYDWGTAHIAKNAERAIKFYNKSADLGYKNAEFSLGKIYETGSLGVTQNLQVACEFYLKAAAQLHHDATHSLEQLIPLFKNSEWEFTLGEIYKNILKDILGSLKWYGQATARGHARAEKCLQDIANITSDYAYEIAKFYENNLGSPDMGRAFGYYIIALRKNHIKTKEYIEALALSGNIETQYILGYEYYYHTLGDILSSVHWCMKAAEKKHVLALDYLTKTNFEADIFFKIAQIYDFGVPEIAKNETQAVEFYLKSANLGYKDAEFSLGKIYETGSLGTTKDLQLACEFYLKAAAQHHNDATHALECLIPMFKNPQWWFQLGEIYQNILNDSLAALKWYRKAAEKKHVLASHRLQTIANTDPQYAYEIGKFYENNFESPDIKEAFCYYIIALHKNHTKTKEYIEELALSGNIEAQYVLGYEYYHQCMGNILAAVNWCLKAAENKHPLADAYLCSTTFNLDIYLYLAKTYDLGTPNISKNKARAIIFYTKASQANDNLTCSRLAELHRHEHLGAEKNKDLSWHNYLKAAKNGDKQALKSLEHLATEANIKQQLELAALYQSTLFYNWEKAKEWLEIAAESEDRKANNELKLFLSKESQKNTSVVQTISFSASTKIWSKVFSSKEQNSQKFKGSLEYETKPAENHLNGVNLEKIEQLNDALERLTQHQGNPNPFSNINLLRK